MSPKPLLAALSWLLYPLVILFGLRVAPPRYVALMLVALLVLQRGRRALGLLGRLSVVERLVPGLLLLLAMATALADSEWLLRLYPVMVNLGMLTLFALTLVFPPSMVERLARLTDPNLPAAAIGYTRRVTEAWCVFFVLNATVAAYTAFAASRETWAFYNGFLAYLLMGALFAGEWLVRRFYLRRAG